MCVRSCIEQRNRWPKSTRVVFCSFRWRKSRKTEMQFFRPEPAKVWEKLRCLPSSEEERDGKRVRGVSQKRMKIPLGGSLKMMRFNEGLSFYEFRSAFTFAAELRGMSEWGREVQKESESDWLEREREKERLQSHRRQETERCRPVRVPTGSKPRATSQKPSKVSSAFRAFAGFSEVPENRTLT